MQGVGAGFEEFGEGGEVVVVADVFEAVDFDDFGLEVGEFAGGAEEFDGLGQGDGRGDQDFRLLDKGRFQCLLHGRRRGGFGQGVDVIDDGIELSAADEGVDVLAVEGRDEGAVRDGRGPGG